jgi:hypothetical protein
MTKHKHQKAAFQATFALFFWASVDLNVFISVVRDTAQLA